MLYASTADARAARRRVTLKEIDVIYTIALVLFVLWILGLATAYTAGGLLHLLLLIAVVMIAYQLITGRRAP
jgi:hypothetical protein